jgi:hypothetical protein
MNNNYRNRRLLDLAHRVQECQLRIPGVCVGHSVDGCEPAHSNQSRHGKGGAMKAHDIFHAAACHWCHAELDQGKKLSREERRNYWQDGFERTWLLYLKQGWLKVTS